MGKIVDLESYRIQAVEKRALRPWEKRFSRSFGRGVRLCDLSDDTLMTLAQPGEGSAGAYYDLIMAVFDLGEERNFSSLKKDEQLRVVDIHLFLADQMRFEMMRRLGWVAAFSAGDCPLVALITDFEEIRERCRTHPPTLAHSRPDYEQYQALTPREREGFIRRLLPSALEAFRMQLGLTDA
jgi:hypothetical protein